MRTFNSSPRTLVFVVNFDYYLIHPRRPPFLAFITITLNTFNFRNIPTKEWDNEFERSVKTEKRSASTRIIFLLEILKYDKLLSLGVCLQWTSQRLNRSSPNFLWQLKLSCPREGFQTDKDVKFFPEKHVKIYCFRNVNFPYLKVKNPRKFENE